ncbi:phosphoglycerate mutase-like protein 4 isoform X1 [Capsicum chacoense]|uniref:Phosphoglycerate mutase-like protein 4 n=1 Tax=Capsicum annuum TaxID=4072 RepID=A0A1U8FJL4_CAPAN|nr:phosphoglycerate mutase-like protein 4 isoform X1 [Capsicum annuum]XP_016558914.1 phosphoglycerate mutase-like protein 4 isoform X1 [Capsicum annuum]XP_016558915.1 phosphoglycerate mutase-like protein 4 isoform X1 [Capsicum annuum]KAF3659509.1 Phosphoglycerate mutase-like protein 4 [Capsicum annuum]PHT89501.1 Phosphoglycerate mutase-like protein 4 [Capsicum annuum]
MISFACGESVKPDIHLLLRHSLTSNPPHFCCPKLLASAAISKRYLIIPTLIFNSIRTPMADSTSRVVSQPECDGDAKSENVTPCFTEIIVIRHGETEWNADGRIQGHLDIELNDVGRQQAMAVAARLSKEPRISVIYSSDLKRAHETAEIIARRCGDLEVIKDPELRERHLGDLQGTSLREAAKSQPMAYKTFLSDRSDQEIPGGGESLDHLYERCTSCLQRIAMKHRGKRVVVVSHGGAIRAFHRRASPHRRSKSKIWNTSVGILHLSDKDKWSVELWADVSHLKKTEFLDSGFGGDKTSG